MFFDTGVNRRSDNKIGSNWVTHVGIYMGNGKFRQSGSKGVTTQDLAAYSKRVKFLGARRFMK